MPLASSNTRSLMIVCLCAGVMGMVITNTGLQNIESALEKIQIGNIEKESGRF